LHATSQRRWPEGTVTHPVDHSDVEPEASSPRHTHDWEHEVFVLAAKGKVYGGGREVDLEPGYTAFVPPMEEHQFWNTGDEVLRFVCLIPLMEQG
jgi:quercetin dioxygenase-like cupin family protein